MTPLTRLELLGRRPMAALAVLVSLAVAGLLLISGGLSLPWLLAALVLALAELGRGLLEAHRQLAALHRNTLAVIGHWPEEFSAVRSLAEELAARAAVRAPEILIYADRQLSYLTILRRAIVVSDSLLDSISRGQQSRTDGTGNLAHELGHVADGAGRAEAVSYTAGAWLRASALLALVSAGLTVVVGGPLWPVLVALVALIGADVVAQTLLNLEHAAGELAADRFAAQLLGDTAPAAESLVRLQLRNALRLWQNGIGPIGAAQIEATLRSLAPLYPDLRLNGQSLLVIANEIHQQLAELPALQGWVDRVRNARFRLLERRQNALVPRYPETSERVRLLRGLVLSGSPVGTSSGARSPHQPLDETPIPGLG